MKSPLTKLRRERAPSSSLRICMLHWSRIGDSHEVLTVSQHAGFAGAALALLAWAWQLKHGKDKPLPGVSAFENETALIKDVKTAVEEGKAQAGHYPRVLVIGALGRCGKGAVDLCTKAGLEDILVSIHSYSQEIFH